MQNLKLEQIADEKHLQLYCEQFLSTQIKHSVCPTFPSADDIAKNIVKMLRMQYDKTETRGL